MSDALINKGLTIVGDKPNTNRPIVVVGTARGGTSMVAGVLAKLGVFMGDKAAAPVYEDTRLSQEFEQGSNENTLKVIKEYTTTYEKWGWKRPSSIDFLDKVDELFNSPIYVFIYKDVLSIAQRNAISMLSDITPAMKKAVKQYMGCIEFLEKKKPYAMLISYDKALSNSENLVHSLAQFYGLTPSKQQIKDALDFVKPNPAEYLDASRITKAQGHLDRVEGNRVFGWARYVHKSAVANVDIYVDDKKVGTTAANLERADLTKLFKQRCAYEFQLPAGTSAESTIRARVSDEVQDLQNSPWLPEAKKKLKN